MQSNYRAHQRWAMIQAVHTIRHQVWFDLKRLLRNFTPKQWIWTYQNELYDIQFEVHEAEQQELYERRFCVNKYDFNEEIPF